MKKFLALLLPLLLLACAKSGPVTEPPEQEIERARWDLMETAPEERPYTIQFSLRFGEEGNTRRITGILWGNDTESLRMDIMAGVGVTVAKISDSPGQFLLYSPRDNKAYVHEGEEKPLMRIGMPLPFTLQMLAALLNGDYSKVFGTEYSSAELLKNGCAAYALSGGPKGVVEVDPEGMPVSWSQGDKGWRMALSPEEGSRLPKSLKFSSSDGKRAIVLVKERESGEAFNKERMELVIPAGAQKLPLSKYRPS